MKSILRMFLATLLVLSVAYVGYSRRYQIAAKVWHWKHGDSIRVGRYEVRVPQYWLVETVTFDTVRLINTAAKKYRDPVLDVNAVISVSSRQAAIRDLDFWKSYTRQRLERDGLRAVEEHTLRIDDEMAVCVGGNELRDVMHVTNTSILSLECATTGTLHLMFVGQRSDLDNFYTIVAQIRKKK